MAAEYFEVDYCYQREGTASRSRTRLRGSVGQNLRGARTESAVLRFLEHKHPGCEILLMSLDWE
ncbi:MAG: hypothetical protein ACO3DJ_19485 [Alphaproteobacteria bacterium]|jgi:hypothetical protein